MLFRSVFGQFSPTDAATSRGTTIERALSSQTIGGAHPFFGLSLPTAPRRRAQEEQGVPSLSPECMGDWLAGATDETAMELLAGSDCPFNVYAAETGEMVGSFPRCEMSAFLDYCDSDPGYKTMEYPNIKVTCLYDGIPVFELQYLVTWGNL